MLQDGFKRGYTTLPFAYYKEEKKNDFDMHLMSHYHKETELIAMIDGTADFYIGSVCYSLEKGDVLIIPPYCMHRADIYPYTSYDCICFDLSLLWDKSLRDGLECGNLTVSGYLSKEKNYTTTVNKCVRDAIAARQQKKSGWEMDVIGNLSLIFGKLKEDNFFIKSEKSVPEHQFAKDVFKYIKEHFDLPVTSATVAEQLHINNSYFCRLFKKTFGCCFAEYLTAFRLEQAKHLLINTTNPISDIASKNGFCSFSYFSKVFKEAVGITPSQYRKQNRQP